MSSNTNKTPNALRLLTGLSDTELAEVLGSNPRAYMAVKGAVAEKHLEKILNGLATQGKIARFRQGKGDFEKDFYFTLPNRKNELVIECKNVEVIKEPTRTGRVAYIEFLINEGYFEKELAIKWLTENSDSFKKDSIKKSLKTTLELITHLSNEPTKTLDSFRRSLPLHLRESGLARYKFSVLLLNKKLALTKDSSIEYLKQFDSNPLSIDFQRTRNSTEGEGEHPRARRFYRVGELDIVYPLHKVHLGSC